MAILYAFSLGSAFALAVSLVTALVLRPHLARLLEELCGSRARAGFWMAVSLLSMTLLGFLVGTTDAGYPVGEIAHPSTQQLFFGMVTQVRGALLGLLSSLLTVAWLLSGFIRRFEQGISPAPVARPRPEPVPAAQVSR